MDVSDLGVSELEFHSAKAMGMNRDIRPGFGHRDAAERSLASLEFTGDALLTDVETICTRLERKRSSQPLSDS
jgi:hypothetical protein